MGLSSGHTGWCSTWARLCHRWQPSFQEFTLRTWIYGSPIPKRRRLQGGHGFPPCFTGAASLCSTSLLCWEGETKWAPFSLQPNVWLTWPYFLSACPVCSLCWATNLARTGAWFEQLTTSSQTPELYLAFNRCLLNEWMCEWMEGPHVFPSTYTHLEKFPPLSPIAQLPHTPHFLDFTTLCGSGFSFLIPLTSSSFAI